MRPTDALDVFSLIYSGLCTHGIVCSVVAIVPAEAPAKEEKKEEKTPEPAQAPAGDAASKKKKKSGKKKPSAGMLLLFARHPRTFLFLNAVCPHWECRTYVAFYDGL